MGRLQWLVVIGGEEEMRSGGEREWDCGGESVVVAELDY